MSINLQISSNITWDTLISAIEQGALLVDAEDTCIRHIVVLRNAANILEEALNEASIKKTAYKRGLPCV